VNRDLVKCLHNRAREIISPQDNLQKEVGHLTRSSSRMVILPTSAPPPLPLVLNTSSPEETRRNRADNL